MSMDNHNECDQDSQPPSKRGDLRLKVQVFFLWVVIIACVSIFIFALYIAMDSGLEAPPMNVPTGSIDDIDNIGATTATVILGKIEDNPPPAPLAFKFINETDSVIFQWQGNATNGSYQTFNTPSTIAITFNDVDGNDEVNKGDFLAVTGLAPTTEYTVQLIWDPTGDCITETSFSTPPE